MALQRRINARNGLSAIAPDDCFGRMVAAPVHSTDAEGLRQHLFDQHRIKVPITQHGARTLVRASVQAYNTQAELDTLVSALASAGV